MFVVERCADAEAFLGRAGEFLVEREAEHNLVLGLAARLRKKPLAYGEQPYFAVVGDGERVVGAALRTPPHNLVLSELDDLDAAAPLAEDARASFDELPGVLGPAAAAARFVDAWRALTGVAARRAVAHRIYAADSAMRPASVSGRMRPYAETDRELVLRWLEAFEREALSEPPPEPAADLLARRVGVSGAGIVLWEHDGPVSLAGFAGATPNGIRVGPVYTPPERRRRGYATVLVAELTRTLLAGGRRFCFLFADLANPTSNAIYGRVGYRPVTDVDQWSFSAQPGER